MPNIPLPTALEDLEKEKLLKVKESYKKCMANVKKTIRSLEVLKNEVAEIKQNCVIDHDKASSKEANSTSTKWLKGMAIRQLLEGQVKYVQETIGNLAIMKNQVAKIDNMCINADNKASDKKGNATVTRYLKLRPMSELLECQDTPVQDDVHPDYVSQMEQLIKSELEKAQNTDNNKVVTSNKPCLWPEIEAVNILHHKRITSLRNENIRKSKTTNNVSTVPRLHRFAKVKDMKNKLQFKCDTCNYACNKPAKFKRHKQVCP